jgi:hypothetical protein
MCGGWVGDLIDDATDALGDFGVGLDAGIYISVKLSQKTLDVLPDWMDIGNLDSALYSLSGDKFRDEEMLKQKGEMLNNISNQISSIQSRLDNKVFLEQIFKYGDIRRIKDLGTSYEQLNAEYQNLLNDYKHNQDGNFLVGITNFIPNVLSALAYNILDYIKTGDSASLRTALSIVLLLVAIVVAIIAGFFSGGSTWHAVGACLAILSAILQLDAMVNNSGLLASAFRVMDITLNKILHLNRYLNTEGFDKDSQYYDSMMNNTRMAVLVASIVVNLWNVYNAPASSASTAASRMAARNADFTTYITTGTYVGQTTTAATASGIAGIVSKYNTFMDSAGSYSVGGVSLSDLYEAYTQASKANDVYGAMTLHKDLQDKLQSAKDELQKNITQINKKKFEASYSDAEYIMNQVDMSYHSYVLQMSEAGMTDVYDPEGTIVMNTRYSPKKSYTFGFEDMFQYESMAGGHLYTYNTLWK